MLASLAPHLYLKIVTSSLSWANLVFNIFLIWSWLITAVWFWHSVPSFQYQSIHQLKLFLERWRRKTACLLPLLFPLFYKTVFKNQINSTEKKAIPDGTASQDQYWARQIASLLSVLIQSYGHVTFYTCQYKYKSWPRRVSLNDIIWACNFF